jgi:MFS family permease
LLVILVVGLVLLFGANFDVALPLFATNVLHVGSVGFGFLSAAISAGSLISSLWLAWSKQKPTLLHVLIGTLAFSVLVAAFAISQLYLLSIALIAGLGFAEGVFGAQAITMLQTLAPDHLRGRVASVYIFFFTGSLPLGHLLTGWLSGLYGAPIALLICAGFCLLVVGTGWMSLGSNQLIHKDVPTVRPDETHT